MTIASRTIRFSLFLFIVCVIAQGCSTRLMKEQEEIGLSEPPRRKLLLALAKLGYADTGRRWNTFYIPQRPAMGEPDTPLYVIYWKEKNVLFLYPRDVTDDAVAAPAIVRGHEHPLEEKSFYRTNEPNTSTYMNTYDWAFKSLVEAVVNGTRHELEYRGN